MVQQKTNEQEIIAAVKQFVNSTSSEDDVSEDLSMLVSATSKLPLKNLDKWERLIRRELTNERQVSKWSFCKPNVSFTWVDLCSGDGFIREKALRALLKPVPNSFFFALAIRRLNDWVPQVRYAACMMLPLIAKNTDPDVIVDALFMTLSHWNSWSRMGDREKQIVMQILSLEPVMETFKRRIILASSGPMSFILTQIGRIDVLDNYLVDIAESAIQPSLRAKAYRCQLDGRFVWSIGQKWVWTDKAYGQGHFMPLLDERKIFVAKPFMDNLAAAAADRSPIVRRVAGEMLIKELENIGAQAVILAKILASDPSPSVAERGEFALKLINK